ncbi:hypothetical protein [Paenibacillus sp. 276b]|uniref:hypothetical protein n=1 Tax=Paenibacillus sp. 276b TaxID=1566277 RepID=UPI00089639BA|nr:hypothetical protein [Paenibacillus sp. 276b]SEA80178.1 hypothetical protein SAMN03159332_2608 [Paenibacillus sp. 276b]
MNNKIQTDVILELQKSIDHMARYGQEMETLDSRFGRLEQRIDAMRSSLSGLQSQVSRGAGSNLRQSLTNELNNLIAGNGIVLEQLGSAGLTVKLETLQSILGKVENEINEELRTHVRNMHIEIDPNYAGGQKLPISKDDFNEINKEVAKVIKLQIHNLVSAIQKQKSNLMKSETLDRLQITIGKETVMAFVNKIKQKIVSMLQNPDVADAGDMKISKADLNKVIKDAKEKLLKALEVEIPDMSGMEVADKVKRIPNELEQSLNEYVNKTVAGINTAMAGKMQIPLGDLSKKVKKILAQELDTTVDKLEALGTVDLGSIRGAGLKAQLERVAKALDKKLSNNVQEEIDQLITAINDVQITPEPKLKPHLMNQINRINNALINKIREQVNVQVQSIIQEINKVQSGPGGLNSDTQIRNAGGLGLSTPRSGSSSSDSQNNGGGTASKGGSSSEKDSGSGAVNAEAVQGAIINIIRQRISGAFDNALMMAMSKAVEAFKNIQPEQIKMMRNLKLKDEYNQDKDGNPLETTNMAGVESAVSDLQNFIRQQSMFYGTDYKQLYQVGGMASGLLDDPVEMKEFVRVTAQLNALAPGSSPGNIANGLASTKAQFGLGVADLEDRIAQPLAVVSDVTKASIEQIIDTLKSSGSKVDPETSIVMAGTTLQAKSLEGANVSNFYNSILNRLQSPSALNKMDKSQVDPYFGEDSAEVANRLQSPEAMKKLQELGLAKVDDTGAKILVPAEELFKSIAEKLSGADSSTVRNTNDALFGTYQSSKGAATMHEIMNTFVKVMEVSGNFDKSKYENMVKSSVDNPLVNTKRAGQSITIAFDALVQEMTPTINKVSYALMNMAENVTKNAQLFVKLGDVLSNVLLGMMLLKGIKWGAGKIGADFRPNFERETARTAFLKNVSGMNVDNSIKNMTRKEVGEMQKDPLLNGYLRDLNGLTEKQSDHFKNYLKSNNIEVKDLPTLFSTMDEAKNWEPNKELTDAEKFDRTKQYNSRLSTRTELASVITPSLLTTLNSSTANQGVFNAHRASDTNYSDLSNRMSQMSQGDFQGFEDHLVDRQRNGLPPIDDIQKLSAAMDDYEKTQREAATSARQASPAFGDLSNAVRGMNSGMSSTASLKNGFKQFLKDIPDLGKGALASVKNLAGGIAKMAMEIAGAIGLAQAAKGLTESYLSTDDERLLAQADDRDNDLKGMANTFNALAEGGWAKNRNNLMGLFYSAKNGISSFFGGTPSDLGVFEAQGPLHNPFKTKGYKPEDLGMMGEIMNYYKFSGTGEEFSKWLKQREASGGQTVEEAVAEFNAKSGRAAETEKMRQKAISKQYEATKLKEAEDKRIQENAEKEYDEKYKEGAAQFSSIDSGSVISRVSDRINEIKDTSQIDTLRALMGGMKTDSDEYIALRKKQTESMRQVLNEELAIIDKYIANAKAVMDSADPESQEYADAKAAYDNLTSTRDKVASEGEVDILQQEWNTKQETYQGQVRKVNTSLSRIDLIAQAKELAAAYNMDTQSQEYLDTMKKITLNKLSQMKNELANLQAIQAIGDLSEDQATQVLQLQNTIANEQALIKEYNLASIGIGRAKIQDNSSDRENELLELKLRTGNPDDSSPILRNKRIANAKEEVSEINQVIADLRAKLPSAGADETTKINAEIRDLQKQSLQTQLGILDEMKSTAGTFNMPNGVSSMSRYEYLTRGNTHNTTTIGTGDVTVNITLPNITNGMTNRQLQQVGQSIGQGLSVGRVGNLRSQQAMNPSNYRS